MTALEVNTSRGVGGGIDVVRRRRIAIFSQHMTGTVEKKNDRDRKETGDGKSGDRFIERQLTSLGSRRSSGVSPTLHSVVARVSARGVVERFARARRLN